MKIENQLIVLELIKSRKYFLDWNTGDIISNAKYKGIKKMTGKITVDGYKQYNFTYRTGKIIQIYGQGFAYLSKTMVTYDPTYVIDHIDKDRTNNKPDNLRCITHRENLKNNWMFPKKRKKSKNTILTGREKMKVFTLNKNGVSLRELARQYDTTRQTIAKICNSFQT